MHTCAGGRSTSKLAQIRISNNLLLKDVEELTGIPQGQLSRYECGYVRELRENRDLTAINKLCELYGISSIREFTNLLEEAYQLNKVKLPETYNSYNKMNKADETQIGLEEFIKESQQETTDLPTPLQTIEDSQQTMTEIEQNIDELNDSRKEICMDTKQYTKEEVQELLKRLYITLEYEDFMMILSLIPQDLKTY